jgi:hypothetical protein
VNVSVPASLPYKTHPLLRSLLILVLGFTALGSVTAFVVTDCRPKPDMNHTVCSGIIGGAGNNTLTADKGASIEGPFFGDGVVGNGGDDVIINNGKTVAIGDSTGTNGDIEGDVATGSGGNDVITNNGTVAGDIDGDTSFMNGGNDVLINSGSVDDDMDGDNAKFNGGDDLIINNGSVGGDIEADDNTSAPKSTGGNDIIVINGSVEGSVLGDFGVAVGGSDTVILQNGADGGSDHELYIDGNDGDDTLVFNFVVSDQQSLDVLATQIKAANPDNDSLTFNGQTFTWKHFDHLENALTLAGSTSPTVINSDHTSAINEGNQAAVYCLANQLRAIGSDAQGQAEYLFSVKAEKVTSALQQAAANKIDVELGTVNGQSLWAKPNGKLWMNDSNKRYDFTFSGTACGG